jgi:hypothetical protein
MTYFAELTGLVAERLAGQPVTRQTLIAAFRGALEVLSPPDVTVAEPETRELAQSSRRDAMSA